VRRLVRPQLRSWLCSPAVLQSTPGSPGTEPSASPGTPVALTELEPRPSLLLTRSLLDLLWIRSSDAVSVTRYGLLRRRTTERQPGEWTVSDDLTGANIGLYWSFGTRATCVLTTDYTVTAADVTAGQITTRGTGDSDQTGPVDDEEVLLGSPSLADDQVCWIACGCGLEWRCRR
jgi:hypothetical protein